ncbi:MAG TPA: DUF3078 domain-containing protein [Bacteroidales bacterium]|nr:DUF3078 domain-containing protein [Bacteroidales bacterium]
MKKVTLLFLAGFLPLLVFAQDIEKVAKAKDEAKVGAVPDTVKHWNVTGTGSLALTQAAFSNWAAGGENSVGLNAFINLKANYHKGRHAWGNTIDLGYGFNTQGKGKEMNLVKTNDKIELTTAYGYAFSKNKKWLVTVLANLRTQFSAGYNYPDDSTVISNFMSPGYLVIGPGITYAPVKWFYAYLSPCSGRFTFVLDKKLSDSGSFGVDPGKQVRGEFGPYFRADLNKDFGKSVNLATTLELFTDYLHKFGNIDVNWSFLVALKVNKWLAASLQTQLIYDDDVIIKSSPTEEGGPRTQFKELFGLGLTYSFGHP